MAKTKTVKSYPKQVNQPTEKEGRPKRTLKPNRRYFDSEIPLQRSRKIKSKIEKSDLVACAVGRRCSKKELRSKKRALKKKSFLYRIICSEMAEDMSIDVEEFVEYLREEIKVKPVALERRDWTVVVTSETFYQKKYLKFLAKKFLQKKNLKNFVHVVSVSKKNYELQYYRTSSEN